jgi:hypothetical protein
MQPVAHPGRPGGMSNRRIARTLLGVTLALLPAAVPFRQVAACSCAGAGTPEQVVSGAELAFIGTVVDTAPGGPSDFGGSNVRYAFEVEQASVPTAHVVVIQALDDGGGASCGMTFGIGERWLVTAYRQGAELETNLCSTNQRTEEMAAPDLVAYTRLLPNVPEEVDPAPGAAGADISIPAATAIVVLSALGLGAVVLLVLRRRRVPPTT